MEIDNPFHINSLTEEEVLQAQVLPEYNRRFIENSRTATAIDKLNMPLDPESYMKSVQEEAYKRGMIDAYTYLLDCSENALQEIEERKSNT